MSRFRLVKFSSLARDGSCRSVGGAAIFLVLCGCAGLQVKLGMKVNLAKIPVTSIDIKQAAGPGIGPGQRSALIVEVRQPDGKMLYTEGAGNGTVMWRDLVVTSTVATVNKKGVLTLPKDPRKSDGSMPHVVITAPSHPELHAELDIPLRYDYPFAANFSGSPGSSGSNGSDGSNGSSGSSGSMDPANPSAGGDGTNGGNGSDGGDGGPGGDAPAVQVEVTLRAGSGGHPLLQARVTAAGHKRLYLIDPQGGSLTVNADGGPGGSGGKGGRGGQGGSGGIGMPSGNSGSNGLDGRNGSDGFWGRGGSITVTYDPQVKAYLPVIHLSSRNGPKPVFQEAAVAQLW